MHVELIGCTSAGKSTLARRILADCRARGIDVVTGDDFVLEQVGLAWLRNRFVRTLAVDACALTACLLSLPTNRAFVGFALGVIARFPCQVGWIERLNLVRNVLKKVGIYEAIHRRGPRERLILVDEGTLQVAHNLFVHTSIPPNYQELSRFARIVPVPELAVYVRQSNDVLIDRTLRRGHRRIHEATPAAVERFVERAVETFDALVEGLARERRMFPCDGDHAVDETVDGPKRLDLQCLPGFLRDRQRRKLPTAGGHPRSTILAQRVVTTGLSQLLNRPGESS